MNEFFEDKTKVRELFVQIADLKNQMKEMDTELKKKEAIASSFFNHIKKDKVETTFGTFIRISTRIWTYSSQVDAIGEQLKSAKKLEEEQGIAKVANHRISIRFNPLNEEA